MARHSTLRILALAAASVLLTFTAAAAQNSAYGIVAHDLDSTRAGKVAELGTGFVRISVRWWQVEPSPGRFDWATMDDYVFGQAAPRGLRIFATLEGPPEWAGGGPLGNQPPDLGAWYRFVHAAVRRYRGHVRHWGLWNEPDLAQFLTDRQAYRDIAYWGWRAVKDADPTASTVGPEVSEGALDDGWFGEIMDSYGDLFDIVSVHIYDLDVAARMDRQVLPKLGGREVWLTETGRRAYAGNNIYEQLQRLYFASVLAAFEPRRPWWTKVFFYDLWSWDRGYRFGICGPDWRNTLAFDYYRSWIAAHPGEAPRGLSPPQDVAARVSGTTVTLTWRAGAGDAPESYVIEVSSTSGAPPYLVHRTGNPATGIVAVAGRGVYFVRLRATRGPAESGLSDEIRVVVP